MYRNLEMKVTYENRTGTIINGINIKQTNVTARLDTGSLDGLTFRSVNTFNNQVKKINRILKKAIKDGGFVKFTIIKYDFDENTTIKKYQSWDYVGYPENDCEEYENGLHCYYLRPGKETDQTHDMVYDYTLDSITA